jgi:hypothetical protein
MVDVRLEVRSATTLTMSEVGAVDEIAAQVVQPGPFITLFFCSARYDLPRLAAELRRAFGTAVYGATSAGQIGPTGFQRGGLTAVTIGAEHFRVTPFAIPSLGLVAARAATIAEEVRRIRATRPPDSRAFGFLMVDGLSLSEERVVSSLYHALGDVPIVGGSAGDDLAFDKTHVFIDGAFAEDAALLLLCETAIPFRTFKSQHFAPTGRMLVVTGAEADRRVVTEINGKPAAAEYARMIGRAPEELTASVFSEHPLLLRIDGDYYVRAIQRANADGTLTLFCAIEEGLVLHLGHGVDAVASLRTSLRAGGRAPDLVLGCDCILRRIELEQRGLDAAVGALFAENRVFGFSTYGEQYNALHVNQTLTGVSIGG